MPKVIVFGSMNMDLSIEADRMPAEGETLTGRGFVTNAGGKGANQAVAAARLGADVRMVAAVGDDAFGAQLVDGLRADGIDVSEVVRSSELSTGVAVIVRVNADNRIVLHVGANHLQGPSDVVAALDRVVEGGDVLLVQGECDAGATAAAVARAHALGMYVIVNPAPARPVDPGFWKDVDLVCLNETECQVMCGILPTDAASRRAAALRLSEMGCATVVITLGSEGSYAMTSSGRGTAELSIPARRADAVDTTAAGDTFIGALAASRCRGLSLPEAIGFATAASAVTVTRVGAQQSIPTAAEVRELLA